MLLTDLVLPEISGGELAERLRARYPTLEVVPMSAHPRELLTRQGRIRADDPYLEKPFEPQSLGRLVAEGVARSIRPG